MNLFEDSGYRSWVESSMSAAGGTTQDVDAFLRLLSDDARHHLRDGDVLEVSGVLMVFALFIGNVRISPVQHPALLRSIHTVFTISTALCFVGIFVSLARGTTKKD